MTNMLSWEFHLTVLTLARCLVDDGQAEMSCDLMCDYYMYRNKQWALKKKNPHVVFKDGDPLPPIERERARIEVLSIMWKNPSREGNSK